MRPDAAALVDGIGVGVGILSTRPESVPPTTELRRRAWAGVRILFGRQVVNQVMGMAAGVALARLLTPAEFGTYAIVTFLVTIFAVLGDFGLGASYIQRQEEITERNLRLSFTLQFISAAVVVAVVWVTAPLVLRLYPRLPVELAWAARIFALTLFPPAIRSVSAVRLERALTYGPIARAEIAESFTYHACSVTLALFGHGVWSFVYAALARSLVGVIVLYAAAPWPLRFYLEPHEARATLAYGISFQAGGVLKALGGWATPAFVGTLVGQDAVGFLGLAANNARRPLAVVDAVMRVSFPHFSRLQGDDAELRATVTSYLVRFLTVSGLWIAVMLAAGGPLVEVIYSSRWAPAVPLLMIYALALPLDMVQWTLGIAYAAVNRNWQAVGIVGTGSLLTLLLSGLAVPRFGAIAIPWSYLIAESVVSLWLLCGFRPGFATQVGRRAVWLVVPTASGVLLGRGLGLLTPTEGSWRAVAALGLTGSGAVVGFLVGAFLTAPRPDREAAIGWLGRRLGRTEG